MHSSVFEPHWEQGAYSSLCSSRTALGPTQLPVQWIPVLFPEVKAAGTWRCPPTPPGAEVNIQLYVLASHVTGRPLSLFSHACICSMLQNVSVVLCISYVGMRISLSLMPVYSRWIPHPLVAFVRDFTTCIS
jgi:hypothetical protein